MVRETHPTLYRLEACAASELFKTGAWPQVRSQAGAWARDEQLKKEMGKPEIIL